MNFINNITGSSFFKKDNNEGNLNPSSLSKSDLNADIFPDCQTNTLDEMVGALLIGIDKFLSGEPKDNYDLSKQIKNILKNNNINLLLKKDEEFIEIILDVLEDLDKVKHSNSNKQMEWCEEKILAILKEGEFSDNQNRLAIKIIIAELQHIKFDFTVDDPFYQLDEDQNNHVFHVLFETLPLKRNIKSLNLIMDRQTIMDVSQSEYAKEENLQYKMNFREKISLIQANNPRLRANSSLSTILNLFDAVNQNNNQSDLDSDSEDIRNKPNEQITLKLVA